MTGDPSQEGEPEEAFLRVLRGNSPTGDQSENVELATSLRTAAIRAAQRELHGVDEADFDNFRTRTLQAISTKTSVTRFDRSRKRNDRIWGFAVAAGLSGIVIGAFVGTSFRGPRIVANDAPELVFAYGDGVVSRGQTTVQIVEIRTSSPQDLLESATSLLLDAHIPFSVYRINASGGRAVTFTTPAVLPAGVHAFLNRHATEVLANSPYEVRIERAP